MYYDQHLRRGLFSGLRRLPTATNTILALEHSRANRIMFSHSKGGVGIPERVGMIPKHLECEALLHPNGENSGNCFCATVRPSFLSVAGHR